MNRRNENWSVEKLEKERTRISFPEYQREKSLWTDSKKSTLIDSILRDIDIPKLYFNELEDKSIEVIDGQQRLWSIWDFLEGKFRYQPERKLFSELSPIQKKTIREYTFQITVFDEAEEDYLRELFVRLQLGLPLNTGERLRAAKGKMKDFVFSTFTNHQFIKALGFSPRRFAKETLCAQICINSFARKKLHAFYRTRYEDLSHFFSEYADPRGKDLELFRDRTKAIMNVTSQLWFCFSERARDLTNRSYILSIYLFIEDHEISPDERKVFSSFIFRLWERLREEARRGIDRENRELYSFQSFLSSAPGEQYQIERRHEKLGEFYDHFKKTKKILGDK
jgi:hypothetical protein